MIIDAHTHLSKSNYGNVEIYKRYLKEAGIDKAVAVPGGMMDVRRMTDYVIGRSMAENPEPDNEYVLECIHENPRMLRGFMCLDPHSDNALRDLEEGYRDGFDGLKFNPMTHQFSFSSRAVLELVSLCQDYNFPVYSHVLFNPGACTTRFIELAKKFRRVNFILGHMGFGPADQDGLEAACKLDNFYLETSTGNYLHMEQTVKKAGVEKLIFGSEFPLSNPKVEMEKILQLKISDDQKDKILGRNIEEILSTGGLSGSEAKIDRRYKEDRVQQIGYSAYGDRGRR